VLAERRRSDEARGEPLAAAPAPPGVLFAALGLMALGFQVHFTLNSAPRYLAFAGRDALPYLMPVFWVGFNLLMFPAVRLVKRLGPAAAMALAAAVGAMGMLLAGAASDLYLLVAAQFLAGGSWGAASVAAYTAAVALGRTGREGRFLGTLYAVLALAVAARIAAVASGAAQSAGVSALLPWLPQTAWLLAALLLLGARGASRPG
jgi:hypothetical protein